MNPGELELSREEMRQLGHQVVDLLVEHFATLRDQPIGRKADRSSLMAALDEPPPRWGTPPTVLLQRLEREVFPNCLRVSHPRFFAFVSDKAPITIRVID